MIILILFVIINEKVLLIFSLKCAFFKIQVQKYLAIALAINKTILEVQIYECKI